MWAFNPTINIGQSRGDGSTDLQAIIALLVSALTAAVHTLTAGSPACQSPPGNTVSPGHLGEYLILKQPQIIDPANGINCWALLIINTKEKNQVVEEVMAVLTALLEGLRR